MKPRKITGGTEPDLEMLREIAGERSFDDANLTPYQRRAARNLYRLGPTDGIPVEGSDANVEVLFPTEAGRVLLGVRKL